MCSATTRLPVRLESVYRFSIGMDIFVNYCKNDSIWAAFPFQIWSNHDQLIKLNDLETWSHKHHWRIINISQWCSNEFDGEDGKQEVSLYLRKALTYWHQIWWVGLKACCKSPWEVLCHCMNALNLNTHNIWTTWHKIMIIMSIIQEYKHSAVSQQTFGILTANLVEF